MKAIATTEEKLNLVHSALCSGLPYFVDYGFKLDYNGHEYNKASKALEAAGDTGKYNTGICIEDVQVQMLRMGYTLKFKGGEGNKASHVSPLNLETIEKNWDKVPLNLLGEYAAENTDAADDDCLMQYLLFGELVYG